MKRHNGKKRMREREGVTTQPGLRPAVAIPLSGSGRLRGVGGGGCIRTARREPGLNNRAFEARPPCHATPSPPRRAAQRREGVPVRRPQAQHHQRVPSRYAARGRGGRRAAQRVSGVFGFGHVHIGDAGAGRRGPSKGRACPRRDAAAVGVVTGAGCGPDAIRAGEAWNAGEVGMGEDPLVPHL